MACRSSQIQLLASPVNFLIESDAVCGDPGVPLPIDESTILT